MDGRRNTFEALLLGDREGEDAANVESMNREDAARSGGKQAPSSTATLNMLDRCAGKM